MGVLTNLSGPKYKLEYSTSTYITILPTHKLNLSSPKLFFFIACFSQHFPLHRNLKLNHPCGLGHKDRLSLLQDKP
ncbi:hypothetical protein V6N13_068819 [Hibiscus sabdariffa]|uniref:Uncharacterized protein n=1 Tax=Hibiscus sabdariffa TaxID=183260 RepID=A0ABR2QNR2_9ROSI